MFFCYSAKMCLLFVDLGQLHEPLNVKIESRNFSLFLTWLPAPKNPSSVTYEVQYTNYSDDNEGTDKFM